MMRISIIEKTTTFNKQSMVEGTRQKQTKRKYYFVLILECLPVPLDLREPILRPSKKDFKFVMN